MNNDMSTILLLGLVGIGAYYFLTKQAVVTTPTVPTQTYLASLPTGTSPDAYKWQALSSVASDIIWSSKAA